MTECLEGTPPGEAGTWFVQGGEALLATLNDLTADEATAKYALGPNSICAHVMHSAYYLELAIDGLNGISRQGDWPGSWAKQAVTDVEWNEAKSSLRQRVQSFLETLEKVDLSTDPDDLTYALANLAHLAYHLGAVRQLYLFIKSG